MSIDPRVTVVELYELARNRSLWSYGFFDDLESHGSSWLQLRDWCLFARGVQNFAGLPDSAFPDLYSVPVAAGDRLLVCSDGLSDELDDEAIATVLAAGYTAQRTAELLVAASLEGGGHDNTTAVVVDSIEVPTPAHAAVPGVAAVQEAQ